jgi:O-antigen/teichoic acid export membrane protein
MPRNMDDKRDLMIPYIVIGLIIWGAILALGAYVFQGQHDLRKPLIILACVGTFVGFWGVLLWINRGRLLRGHHTRTDRKD